MALPYSPSGSFQKKRNAELSKAIFGNHPALGATTLKSPIQPAKTQPFDLGTAYENNQKMQYRQQGIDSLKPPEPFKMDMASIQSDPTYQAAMQSAKEATQIAEGDISAAMNRRGIMDSSITANTAANAAQREYGRVNRELLPQLIQDQYKRYIDQANMNRQYASDLFGVSDMYRTDEQDALNRSVVESDITGSYIPPEARPIMDRLITLKQSTEAMWSGLTPEQRQLARQQGDQLRAQLQALGVDPSLFGADVTSTAAQGNISRAGIPTLAGQAQDFNQATTLRQLDRADYESDRDYNFAVGQQEWENNFKQGQFDWQKAQQSWENAFQEKNFEQQMKEAAASRGLQWANLGQRQKEFIADQAFREKQFQYQMEQDDLDREAANNQPIPYQNNPLFAEDIADINADPVGALADIKKYSTNLISEFGYEGYQALLKAAEQAQPKIDRLSFLNK